MPRLTNNFLARIKLNSEPAYRIARKAGIHHTTLSRLINGIEPIKPDDPRIVAVGRVLGLSAEDCFEHSNKMETSDE